MTKNPAQGHSDSRKQSNTSQNLKKGAKRMNQKKSINDTIRVPSKVLINKPIKMERDIQLQKWQKCNGAQNKQIQKFSSLAKMAIGKTTQRNLMAARIMSSSLYKKLLEEFKTIKNGYNQQISLLSSEIKQLDDQIILEKHSVLNLINKRNKMDDDIRKYTNELMQLQQKNYEMYWDVAARINLQQNQDEDYEDLLHLGQQIGSVSKGLSPTQLQQLIKRSETTKFSMKQERYKSGSQTCCICCQDIGDNQPVVILDCQHYHHTECIRQWLEINKACPLCRMQIKR